MTSKAIPLPNLAGFTQRNGNWYAEEIPLSDLAKEFGTPLYVYSKKALTEAYQAYDKACVDSTGKRRARVHYAMKANSNLAVIDCFKKLGSGFDLVSGGELARALAVGAEKQAASGCQAGQSGKTRSLNLAKSIGVNTELVDPSHSWHEASAPESNLIHSIPGVLHGQRTDRLWLSCQPG